MGWREILRVRTKKTELTSTQPYVSVIGHITPFAIQSQLQPGDITNGFANRFLWLATRPVKRVSMPARIIWSEHQDLIDRLRKILETFRGETEITFSASGLAAWEQWYDSLPTEQDSGVASTHRELCSRPEAHVLRLALIFTLLDNTKSICAEHLTAALAVWRYCVRSVLWIFREKATHLTAVEKRTAQLSARLRESPMTISQINDFFGGNLKRDEIDQVLRLLSLKGEAEERPPDGGKVNRSRGLVSRWYGKTEERK